MMSTAILSHGLFGWLSNKNQPGEHSRVLQQMKATFNSTYRLNSINQTKSTCATTGELTTFGKDKIAAILGNPVWKDKTLHQLSKSKGNAEALAEAYTLYGNAFIKKLNGDFACVVIDSKNDRLLLVTDRFGRHPIYYRKTDEAIVFSTSPSSLHKHPALDKELLPQGIYNYVYFHMVPSPSTIYRNTYKLPAATLIDINSNSIKSESYYVPSFTNSTSTFSSLSQELKNLLKQAVEDQVDTTIKTGAFLSGGLDSSTVAGMFSELATNQADAFSIGFSAKGYDEMPFARLTAKHFGIKLHEYYVTPEDVVAALPQIATSYDEPFGNSSALPAYFCAKFAKENGIGRLLAGDGGDELFAGNERYVKQSIFEIYHKIPRWVRELLIEPLASNIPKRPALLGKIDSYITQANTPLPDRLQSYNFLHQHNPVEIFSSDFLSTVESNIPLAYQSNIYNKPQNVTTLSRMLYLDWQYTLADNDLRKVSHMCAMAEVEVAYPMLADSLLEFSCKIPDKWKIDGRKLRHFYKESLRGWLPDETIQKRKQGFGLPFGVWMQTHKPLQDMAYDNLTLLKKRNYFDANFIDKVIDLHRHGHAAYYGELVWILTVLELWLDAHDTI